MDGRNKRHKRIIELIEQSRITSQEHLQSLLREAGIEVAQATLSRDLRELGVVKGGGGYMLPGARPKRPPTDAASFDGKALRSVLAAFVLSVDQGQNLVVLRIGPGHAQLIAIEIDRAGLPGAMGSVAGDDTIFIAARSDQHAEILAAELRKLAGLNQPQPEDQHQSTPPHHDPPNAVTNQEPSSHA